MGTPTSPSNRLVDRDSQLVSVEAMEVLSREVLGVRHGAWSLRDVGYGQPRTTRAGVAMRLLVRFIREPEVIGVPECPLLHRWTLLDVGRRVPDPSKPERMIRSGFKFMVHHFLPESRDRDPHDHPRPFLTVVLRGGYENHEKVADGIVRVEHMKPGTIRLRSATHAHTTYAGSNGCWTFVVMGPLERPWGFWKDGKWWPWRIYEEKFGHGMRCD